MLRTTEHVYHSESQAYMRRNPVIQITRYNIAVIFGTAQSELLGQFRLISDRASDVSGGRICLTQNAYAEL